MAFSRIQRVREHRQCRQCVRRINDSTGSGSFASPFRRIHNASSPGYLILGRLAPSFFLLLSSTPLLLLWITTSALCLSVGTHPHPSLSPLTLRYNHGRKSCSQTRSPRRWQVWARQEDWLGFFRFQGNEEDFYKAYCTAVA